MTFFPSPCPVTDLPGCAVLALPPEIDHCNATMLRTGIVAYTDARATDLRLLVLDLTGVRFMDSQGARLVQDVHSRLDPRIRLRVVATPLGLPSRVLELTGVRRDVPVYDNLPEALAL